MAEQHESAEFNPQHCKRQRLRLLGIYDKLVNKMKEGQEEEVKSTSHPNYILTPNNPEQLQMLTASLRPRNTVCPWCLVIRI